MKTLHDQLKKEQSRVQKLNVVYEKLKKPGTPKRLTPPKNSLKC